MEWPAANKRVETVTERKPKFFQKGLLLHQTYARLQLVQHDDNDDVCPGLEEHDNYDDDSSVESNNDYECKEWQDNRNVNSEQALNFE